MNDNYTLSVLIAPAIVLLSALLVTGVAHVFRLASRAVSRRFTAPWDGSSGGRPGSRLPHEPPRARPA